MSYYEHEIKVKIIDNILSHSKDWDWFIRYTEKNFNLEKSVNSLQDALYSINDFFAVFDFLCKIREFIDDDFQIASDWLKELDQLALLYVGKRNVESVKIQSDFAKIILLLIYSGKIYSQIMNEKYYFYSDIFKVRNLFSFIDIDLFIDEEDTILKLFDNISIDLSEEIKIYQDNINHIEVSSEDSFVKQYEKDFYNANCFSYSRIDADIKTWEEREIINMLLVSYSNDKITPAYSNGHQHNPMYEIWKTPILEHISDYFNADCVNFIVESIGFALHKTVPSEKVINQHFEFLYELSEQLSKEDGYKISCSSLEFIISFFNNENCCKEISSESYIKFSKVLNKIYDLEMYHILFKLKERNALLDNQIRKKLNDIIFNELDKICNISNSNEFLKFIRNKKLYSHINNEHFEELSEKFNAIIIAVDTVKSALMFLQYFLFLLKIKNNKDVISFNVGQEIIRIRKLWQEEYYLKSSGSMAKITSEPISVPSDMIDNYVYFILTNPFDFASVSLKLKDSSLVECMMEIAKNPMCLLVSRIIIAEDFPQRPFMKIDKKHPIDEFYLKEIEKQIQQNGYKFLNVLKPIEFATGIYSQIKTEIQINMSFLKSIKPLYDEVIKQNTEYQFIELLEKPNLAHLTQLFPILENKIRKLGEALGIVPVCESEELCHRLKEPDGILKTIISEVYAMEESLNIVSDLFFVHFCMFGENGLNIRNECVHGNGYFTEQQIEFAFKITLICLYMTGLRYKSLIGNS